MSMVLGIIVVAVGIGVIGIIVIEGGGFVTIIITLKRIVCPPIISPPIFCVGRAGNKGKSQTKQENLTVPHYTILPPHSHPRGG